MPRVQLPVVTPKHKAWNKGRIIGQKRPLLPKQVWAIRARLELAGYLREAQHRDFFASLSSVHIGANDSTGHPEL